jgi:hypothetical protein
MEDGWLQVTWARLAASERSEKSMITTLRIAKLSFLLGLIAFTSACVVEPHEGYWDHDHNRYYHEHAWHDCGPGDNYCR